MEAVFAFGVGPEVSSGLSGSGGGGLLLGLVVLGTYTNWMCLLHMAQCPMQQGQWGISPRR